MSPTQHCVYNCRVGIPWSIALGLYGCNTMEGNHGVLDCLHLLTSLEAFLLLLKRSVCECSGPVRRLDSDELSNITLGSYVLYRHLKSKSHASTSPVQEPNDTIEPNKTNLIFLLTHNQPQVLIAVLRIWIRVRSDLVFLGRPKNTPVIRYIKLSKIQFRQNNFLSLILSVIRCLDLVRKCHNKNYLICSTS